MSTLRERLIEADKSGNFVKAVLAELRNEEEGALAAQIADLHNTGVLDAITAFEGLHRQSKEDSTFFLARHILEIALPLLNAPVEPVAKCVLRLFREAGADMMAGEIIGAFIAFCSHAASRSWQVLALIEQHPDQYADLLPAALIAGSRSEPDKFLTEAIRLARNTDLKLARQALFTLGKLNYANDARGLESALAVLENATITAEDDEVMAATVRSATELLTRNKEQEPRLVSIIDRVLAKGSNSTLYAASELFVRIRPKPPSFLAILLNNLKRTDPNQHGTIGNIDLGINLALAGPDRNEVTEFLEALLVAHPEKLSLGNFDLVLHTIGSDPSLLNSLMTRWFLRGDPVLCAGIQLAVTRRSGTPLALAVAPSELTPATSARVLFLAHKIVGFLFMFPTAATGALVSLMSQVPDDRTLELLSALVFDPLILSFPAQVREQLIQLIPSASENLKAALQAVCDKFDTYLQVLKTVGDISELQPSEEQREAHRRHFSRLMSASVKAAQEQSLLFNMVSKSVLLYGRKSIDYVYEQGGEPRRIETALTSRGTTMDFPRMEQIDPFGVNYKLLMYRAERLKA
jgi:hypothetical protein